jgi:uncharacterized protein YukJ
MALERYGVLIGTLQDHARDQPDTQGRWYHVNLRVTAPLGLYRCAVDVDSKQSATGVEWKVLTAAPALISAAGLAPGYHDLPLTSSSGALDYYRHPALARRPGCLFVRQPPARLQQLIDRLSPGQTWTGGSNLEAATALEGILAPGRRILVFGEPFSQGLGMHNIHQNQGDPAGSQWWDENAIWQDGATVMERPDGTFDVFISKFSTQSTQTDDDGHPV